MMVWQMHLLSNMAILFIYLRFWGCISCGAAAVAINPQRLIQDMMFTILIFFDHVINETYM